MALYVATGTYTAEGYRGLAKDGASGRKEVLTKAMTDLGGELRALYYTGDNLGYFVIAELPDDIGPATIGLAILSSGMFEPSMMKFTRLLEVEDVDRACKRSLTYPPPGKARQ